ncbi:MAG: SDR family oxidoreductase [Myxococcales bacterium]|nr:SDR family oxidoreductase [Myxococcales bacterium]
MTNYRDKVVLITGGASGIGKSLGERLVAQGAKVVLADIDETRALLVADELGCAGVGADVTQLSAVRHAVDFAEATYGPLDVMINNAGVAVVGEAHTFEHEDWRRIIDVNLYGVIHGVHAVYGDMVARGAGQIINIASIAGLFPSAGQAAYVTSKYGVVGLSHALRAEASGHGVRVNVVCPGIIRTAMRDELTTKDGRGAQIRALLPRGADVDACARSILRGARRNSPTIVITPLAHGLAWLMRLAPRLGLWLNQLSFRMLLRRMDSV